MKRIFAGMTFDEVTEARKALFATGTMFLHWGEMVSHRSEHAPLADLYNRLAANHGLASHTESQGGPGCPTSAGEC